MCIIDYNSKLPIIKRLEGLSAENLTNAVKIIFVEYGIPCKIMSDAGTNFVSEKSVEQSTLSKQHRQHTITKVMGRLRPVSNLLSKHLKNVPNLVGT